MKHVYALLIKFVMVAVILEIILNAMTNLTFSDILYVSAAVTIVAYIVGDLLILPASNNTIATISDIVLSLITIYMFNFLWSTRYITFMDALVPAVIIGVCEWFFHKYLANKVFPEHKEK
jgi:hypothetical protein